jgi:hypothetical protein
VLGRVLRVLPLAQQTAAQQQTASYWHLAPGMALPVVVDMAAMC